MDEKEQGGLSAAEEAYFETGGEASLEAEPQVEQQPEQVDQVEQQQEGPARDDKGRFVPHQALHAEREEHKKTRAEVQELREFKARMEERMQWMAQASQPQPQEETPPDPNQDIFAALKYERDKREALEKRIAEEANERARQNEQALQERAIWSEWETSAHSYKQQNPDFDNAAKWLAEFRENQLKAFAVLDDRFQNPQARNLQINEELKAIIVQAKQRGVSPAEMVYQIAKGYGYQGQGQQPKLALPEQLQKVAQAQNASKSLGQAPGAAAGSGTTLEDLMSMNQADFGVWLEASPENRRLFNRLMGA